MYLNNFVYNILNTKPPQIQPLKAFNKELSRKLCNTLNAKITILINKNA